MQGLLQRSSSAQVRSDLPVSSSVFRSLRIQLQPPPPSWIRATLATWSAVIVAVVWGIVAAVLYFTGKREFDEVEGMPQTVETVKEIPETLKRNEENR